MITPGQASGEGEQSDHESVGSTCTGDCSSANEASGSEWEYSIGDKPKECRYEDEDDDAYDEGWWSKMAVGKHESATKTKKSTK